jgi:DNA-binding HxlR family transcriptional regulator
MTAALAAVGGKWNLIVLYWLAIKPRRFHELREVMSSISQKVLTQTLRDLEANGLVIREASGRRPPTRVEYSLSRHGETLAPVVEAVRLWGHQHLQWANAHEAGGASPAIDASSRPMPAPPETDPAARPRRGA